MGSGVLIQKTKALNWEAEQAAAAEDDGDRTTSWGNKRQGDPKVM